jgi:hypothetical protein
MNLKVSRHQRLFRRSLLIGLVSAILFFFTPFQVMADTDSELINQRIEKLEKELAELKTLLKEKNAEDQKVANKVEDDNKKVETAAAAKTDRFKFSPYGYIKLDASYDDSAVSNGDYVIYVPTEAVVSDDNEFNMTARQTRLGLVISAPDFEDWKTKGKVEIDFYGNGPAVHENKSEIVMRHAFLEFKRGNLGILAGQTWDVISPLNLSTLNYTVGWAAGNIGYRRPQIRLTYNTGKNDPMTIFAEYALTRTSGLTNEDLDAGGQNDGEDSGIPTMQGRIALATELMGKRKSVFGISGHYGEEEVDWAGSETDMRSWSVNWDFTIPIYDRFTLEGEVFIGENLDDYFGGILQGVNTTTQSEIRSRGVWTQLSFKPDDKWQYNAGFGLDDPDHMDINDSMRDKNTFYFANALFKLAPPLTLGLEYSYWATDYKNLGAGRDNRLQFSCIYSWK